jgi:PAS domain S-box-containing protein
MHDQSSINSRPESRRLTLSVARRFLAVGAVTSALGAASIEFQDFNMSPALVHGLAAACLSMALLFTLAAWKASALSPKAAVLGTSWAACLLVTGIAVASGFSIMSQALGFFGLLCCFVAVLAGARQAVAMALFGAGVIGGLALAEHAGWLNGAAVMAAAPLSDAFFSQLLLLAAGLGVGLAVARVADDSLRGYAEREQRFSALLRMAADRYWELDADLRFVRVDSTAGDTHAAAAHTPFGLRPWETPDHLGIPPELRQAHQHDLLARRSFQRLRVRMRTQDGRPGHFEVGGEPRFDSEGRFVGYWGTARDISEEVAAEQALRQSQAMLSLLFANSPDCITLTELASGKFKMVNGGFTRLIGYTVDEAVGRTSLELGIWDSRSERDRFVADVRSSGVASQRRCVFVARGGTRVVMQVAASRCTIDGDDCVIINARDVTDSERTRMEYAAILQRASVGIAFTRERVFATANPCFERMFGWEPGGLAGQSGRVVWPNDTDYVEIGRAAGPRLEAGQPVEMEREMRRRDGSLFWCRLLAQALDPSDARGSGTIWIAEDVTERHNAERALAAARDAAEAASRAKSSFLANTSHEIRTPLNGLLGMARLALQPGVDDTRRQQYLSHILDSAQNLAGIISDILDLSKVEAGRVDLERLPFGLHDMLGSLHQTYQSLAEAKGLVLRLALDDALPHHVSGDPLRVRQVLGNFISNALKFTERGEVTIEARCSAAGRIRLAVSDTGPGIPADVQARLFEPFSQADESTTRRYGGTGLGLSICRELARLMGGAVGLHSVPGEGSTFWAELPLPEAEVAPSPGGTATAAPEPLHGVRVLVAEDNPVNMLITVALLEQWGVEVTQAADGRAAVAAVHEAARGGHPFDVVLMDMHMPQMSGDAAARALREHFDAERLPIIALTAAALVSERDEALRAGMDDFLTKPVDPDLMRRTLSRHVARVAAP